MLQRFNIYISSTSTDLHAYRERAIQAVLRLGAYPVAMENFGSAEQGALQLCYNQLQEVEVFIGIYAYRYGYIPGSDTTYRTLDGEVRHADGKTSIVELEYQWATEKGIPLLLFVLGGETAWPPTMIDDEPGRTRLEQFKQKILESYVVGFFSSPDDLAAQIAASLASIIASNKQIVTTRGTTQEDQDCIPNFDDRVLNAVLKAIEISDAFKASTGSSEEASDDPHVLHIQPSFSTPPSRLPQYQCDVFVIMPFAEQFRAVFTDVIQPLCDGLQLVAKR